MLTLCLWALLLACTWDADLDDADAVFGALLATLISAIVLSLPAAFILGLAWRTMESVGEVCGRIRDHRRARRHRPPPSYL